MTTGLAQPCVAHLFPVQSQAGGGKETDFLQRNIRSPAVPDKAVLIVRVGLSQGLTVSNTNLLAGKKALTMYFLCM